MNAKTTMVVAVAIVSVLVSGVQAEDPVYFADANLKAAVEAALGVTDPTQAQMATLLELSADGRGILDLTGIEYAVNLTTAYLSDNQISDLSPLAGLANLTQLHMCRNQISGISALSGLTNLAVLWLWDNQISDISPLSGMTMLTNLNLEDNQVGDISVVAGMPDLTWLLLNDNQVSDISPLTNLTSLTVLELGANQISDASPLAGLTNLTWLNIGGNQISNVSPLSDLTSLTVLGLQGDQVSDISPLVGLTNLTSLDLNDNQVQDISVLSNMTNLTLLALENNQISDLSPLAAMTNLGLLALSYNPLSWDSHFVYIPLIEANNPGIDIQYDPWVDTDMDGISAVIENGAPNDGDGNGDTIPDGLQNEVASLPNAVDAGYVTLESPGGTDLVGVSATGNPSPEPLPEGVEFPIGFFEFTVQGITPGAAVVVTLFTSAEVGTYYKYGPTPDSPTDHWYEFLYDGTTGAEILSDRVVLHLVDGLRGDGDLSDNGEIVEPGGPGLSLNPPPAVHDLYLHGVASDLTLDDVAPTGTTAKYKDSPSINRTTFKEIGTWRYGVPSRMLLQSVEGPRVWIGLKNSDDQGTYFDLCAELLRNGVPIASCVTENIQGVTRNPDKAKEVVLDFGGISEPQFNPGDVLALRVLAKVTAVGGHNNAVGLRLYYDSLSRPSRLEVISTP